MSKKVFLASLFIVMVVELMMITCVSAAGEIVPAKFVFGPGPGKAGYTKVTSDTRYNETKGYGFATEAEAKNYEFLNLAEIGDGFALNKAFDGQQVTNIVMEERKTADDLQKGACYSDKADVPITFLIKVPHNGNYNVKMTIGGQDEDTKITLLTQNRRVELHEQPVKAGQYLDCSFTVNVSDIFVRDRAKMYPRDTVAITLVGSKASISSLTVEEAPNTPTVWILGDSTLTDQSAIYPYNPAASYCGWAQQLPQFFKAGIAVSNHAHSGWTTADPINKGEWAFIQNNIKPNDYFFIQFGHNDQKNANLTAEGGFTDNLKMYIEAVKAKGAIPVIVTPLTRINKWADSNTIENSLGDYAEAGKAVAADAGIALIDLNEKSMNFMGKVGQKKAPIFYAPKDFTHNNTYGAYEMAKIIYQGIQEKNPGNLAQYLRTVSVDSEAKLPDVQGEAANLATQAPKRRIAVLLPKEEVQVFTDINDCWAKKDIEMLAQYGIADGKNGKFFPDQTITRKDLYVMVLKAIGIPPANVYNDMYKDVMGNEWYGGAVEAAFENGLIDQAMTPNQKFTPDKEVTREELTAIIMSAYKNVKGSFSESESIETFTDKGAISAWTLTYVRGAKTLGIVGTADTEFQPQSKVTRAQAAAAINDLLNKLK